MSKTYLVPLRGHLFEYRMRCDCCNWSGPWASFTHGEDAERKHQIDVCDACFKDEQWFKQLCIDGWVFA